MDITSSEKIEQELKFAISIATVGGVEPSEFAKELFRLYKRGVIDLETAKNAIKRMYTK